MQRLALLLALLLYVGNARRVQSSNAQSQRYVPTTGQQQIKLDDRSQALAMLLLTLNPAIAFNHCGTEAGVIRGNRLCRHSLVSSLGLRDTVLNEKVRLPTDMAKVRIPGPVMASEGVTRGVGAGRELPSPSRINTLPTALQAAITIFILFAIGVDTALLAVPVFDAIRGSDLWALSRPTWPILGLIYLAAGIAHFTELEGFENITPPNGTWGWYYTPFSTRFNVQWTGVVEIFGGSWMLFGALAPLAGFELPAALGPVVSDAALTLFLLTILVTPANIYALTHGANFPLDVETPPLGHAIRLAFQPVLLAMFWEMAQPTLLDARMNLGLM